MMYPCVCACYVVFTYCSCFPRPPFFFCALALQVTAMNNHLLVSTSSSLYLFNTTGRGYRDPEFVMKKYITPPPSSAGAVHTHHSGHSHGMPQAAIRTRTHVFQLHQRNIQEFVAIESVNVLQHNDEGEKAEHFLLLLHSTLRFEKAESRWSPQRIPFMFVAIGGVLVYQVCAL